MIHFDMFSQTKVTIATIVLYSDNSFNSSDISDNIKIQTYIIQTKLDTMTQFDTMTQLDTAMTQFDTMTQLDTMTQSDTMTQLDTMKQFTSLHH